MSAHDLDPSVVNLRPTSIKTVLGYAAGICGVVTFVASFAVPIIRAPRENDFTTIQQAVQEMRGDLREIKAANAERINTERERELRRDLELKDLRELITRRR